MCWGFGFIIIFLRHVACYHHCCCVPSLGGLKAEDLDFQLPLPDYEVRDLRAKLKQPRAEHHLDVVGTC